MKNEMLNWKMNAGTITLCPLRGRVLQVEIEDKPAFWVNPSHSGDWNIGGDRLWIAPEVDWYWKTLKKADFEKYEIPEAIDPGNWTIARMDKNYWLVSQMGSLNNQHKDSNVQFELVRSFTSLELPRRLFFKKHIMDSNLTIVGLVPGNQWTEWLNHWL